MENTKETAVDKAAIYDIHNVKNEWCRQLMNTLPEWAGVYAYEENTGICPICTNSEEAPSGRLENVFLEEDYSMLLTRLAMAYTSKQDIEIDVRCRQGDNQALWMRIRVKWMENQKEHLFLLTGEDITKEKEFENQLFLQQQKYKVLQETTTEILFEYQVEKNEMSYSLKELNGVVKKMLIPFYFQSFENSETVHPDYRTVVEEHFQKAILQPCRDEYEYLSRISGNGYEWHRMVYISVEDMYGKVSCVIGRIRNIHDEVLERRILNTKANVDHMTRLFNKNYIKDTINAHLVYSGEDDNHILVMIGIDRFNRIIEQNGHACGDMVVQKVSTLLQDTVAKVAILGRQGNENFLAYVENSQIELVDACVEEFLHELHKEENKIAEVEIACSVGAAVSRGITDFDELYEKVDEALYLAKITKDTHYVRV